MTGIRFIGLLAVVATTAACRTAAANPRNSNEPSAGPSVATSTSAVPAGVIRTGLHNPIEFAVHCPGDDPAFAVIRRDFGMLSDGVPSTADVACTDPYSTMSPMSEELVQWQVLRLAYTISQGTAGRLPWTQLALYDWIRAQIAGIDIRRDAGNSYCCESIGGKRYFVTSRDSAPRLDQFHDWIGLSNWLGLILHEARHVAGPPHVVGCPAFPSAFGPPGCDTTYDLQNLGSFGVQYWLFSSLANGTLDVGIGCLQPDTAKRYATSAARDANGYASRFVANAPPLVTATVPYGGTCLP
jgi:hypothetical protein